MNILEATTENHPLDLILSWLSSDSVQQACADRRPSAFNMTLSTSAAEHGH